MRPIIDVIAELEADLPSKLIQYARTPEMFMEEVLRMDGQPWQRIFWQAVADARSGRIPQRRFSVRSGTGVGKTSGVAGLILWHLACFPDSKLPCTAPTSPQIKAVLWPEIRKWVAHIPDDLKPWFPYEVTGDKVELYENFAVARTAREETPEAMQGFHAKNIMLLVDEASGVPDAIFNAGQGVMSSHGAITILIGNPTRATGWFFDSFHSDAHLYWNLAVSCADTTMVRSDIVAPGYVAQMREKHGENSYEYRVRVLGEFHLEDTGLIVPRPWVEASWDRDVERDSDWVVWGCDPSDGRDKFGLAKRAGNTLLERTKAWGGKTVMQSVGMVVDEYYATPKHLAPDEICVEVTGMGTAFLQRLKEALTGEKIIFTAVNPGLTGKEVGDRYVSRAVELAARVREWYESMIVKGPVDKELMAEMCSIEWEVKDSNGKWAIVDKKSGGESPARFDALRTTFGGVKGRHKGRFTLADKMRNMSGAGYASSTASYLGGN
jgi:phage terminase large subunit